MRARVAFAGLIPACRVGEKLRRSTNRKARTLAQANTAGIDSGAGILQRHKALRARSGVGAPQRIEHDPPGLTDDGRLLRQRRGAEPGKHLFKTMDTE